MVQKYQNEIAPIFYYGISTKTNEKDLKIPDLEALTLGRVKKITLYIHIYAPSGLVIHVIGLLAAGLLGPLLGLSAAAGAGRRGCSS